jgi:hypothetical protein
VPVSGQLSETADGGPAMMSRFPAAFRPPAFASWSSCARWGAGPSLRSAYRSCCQGRTPTGLPRSARMSCGRGGCPLYPGDCGARTAGRSSPAAACRLAAARPCAPVQRPTTGGFLSRGIIKGSRSFTRPAFPSPVAPGWSGSPWAYPPRASHPAVTSGACRGGDRQLGHLPELRHHQLVLQSTQPLTACDLVSH